MTAARTARPPDGRAGTLLPVVLVDPLRTGRPFKERCRARSIPVVSVYTLPAERLREMDPDYRSGDTVSIHTQDAEVACDALAGGAAAVIGTTEPSVLVADRLAELLDLPGNPVQTSLARRDKAAMRHLADAVGIAVPAHEVITSPEQFPAVAARIGYPVVLKQRTGAGAHGVHLVRDGAAGIRHCTERSTDLFGRPVSSWLVEEYVRGREIAVNTFTWDGRTTVVDMWEYRRDGTEDYDQPYHDVIRLDAADPDWTAAAAFAVGVAQAFDVRLGPSHVELKVSARGPVLIEIASRLPGAHMTDHWARHSDAAPYDGVLDAFLGNHPGSFATGVAFSSSTAVCCITHDGPAGVLHALTGLTGARELPGVDEVFVCARPGSRVPTTTGLDSVVVLALISGPDPEAVDKTIRSVRNSIHLEIS